MFGNKKRDRKIANLERWSDEVNGQIFPHPYRLKGDIKNMVADLENRLKALEDYLNIEWKEESTKGYVKKEAQQYLFGDENGLVGWGGFTERQKELLNRIAGNGRKSNNKKK